jgi:hypothetical protein
MEALEKTQILQALENGREAILEALSGVTEDHARRSPGPGRWSVLECAEHVAVAEDLLFSRITQATASATPCANKAREAAILAHGADRTNPRESPEEGKPTGRFSTLTEAVQHFHTSREETVRFVEDCRDDLRAKVALHPLAGPVNCYEMLLIMAVHPRCHADQIREIKAALA